MKTPPRGGAFNLAFQHVSGRAVRRPADRLAAAGRASAVHPAAAGRASAVRPAAGRASVVRPAAAGQASRSDFDFDSSFSPTLVRKRRSIRAPWQKVMRQSPHCSRAVPVQLSKKIVFGTPTSSDVFLDHTRGIDNGTLSAAVAARGANSNSPADLDFRWFALADAGTEATFGRHGKYTVGNVL